jgi:predicted nuclease with TOPRIM domain
MATNPQPNFDESLFSDINVKLRDIEEKQNIIKDRVLLIGENLVSEKEETNQEISEIKASINNLNEDIRKIKSTLQLIIENSNNFARKSELEMLERQFEMFSPLEAVRISDLKSLVQKEIKANKKD